MAETRNCSGCGEELPPDAPGGLCPVCLIGLGWKAEDSDPAEKSASEMEAAEGGKITSKDRSDAKGRDFGPYQILGELGRGGMGIVYQARETMLNRDIALKILPKKLASNPTRVKRFLREARAAASLTHPNIVPVYAVGELKGSYYIAMEYIRGKTLHDHLKEEKQIEVEEGLQILKGVAEALREAHRQGMIHRDIKPSNIMIDQYKRPRVLDFGLAQVSSGDSQLTADGARLGTPSYMSPEQCRSGNVDVRTDIYSLGVTLYVMLSGRLPFPGTDPLKVMFNIIHDPFPDLEKRRVGLPLGVYQLLQNMVAKDPSHRYESLNRLIVDLDGLLKDSAYQVAPLGVGIKPKYSQPVPKPDDAIESLDAPVPIAEEPEPLKDEPDAVMPVYSVEETPDVAFPKSNKSAWAESSTPASETPLPTTSRSTRKSLIGPVAAIIAIVAIGMAVTIFYPWGPPAETQRVEERTGFIIAGFYGAANNAGTFIRTLEDVGAREGDTIEVTGTEMYDGTWIVLQAFPNEDSRDSVSLSGYRIAKKWEGFPPGFGVDGESPDTNNARVRVVNATHIVGSNNEETNMLPGDIPIAGFYGAANNAGTFIRTLEDVGAREGDTIEVIGTEMYDGTWTVLQAFPYKDPRDPVRLFGYRIAKKWEGFPPGFGVDGESPDTNNARVRVVNATHIVGSNNEETNMLAGDIPLDMIYIPPGTFMMGSPSNEKDRTNHEQQHPVTLTNGFWLGKYEVTQEQWEAVMGSNPSRNLGASNPVENVNWEDCQEFLKELNARSGGAYRLPTEAEWEYACRAGTTTAYSFGDTTIQMGEFAWYSSNSEGHSHPVGGKRPNGWGLYDMHGNVWEWCSDWLRSFQRGSVTNPIGPSSGSVHVKRGGCFGSGYDASICRSARRGIQYMESRNPLVGLRLAR